MQQAALFVGLDIPENIDPDLENNYCLNAHSLFFHTKYTIRKVPSYLQLEKFNEFINQIVIFGRGNKNILKTVNRAEKLGWKILLVVDAVWDIDDNLIYDLTDLGCIPVTTNWIVSNFTINI